MRRTSCLSLLFLLVVASPAWAAGDECARKGLAESTGTPVDEIVIVEAEHDPVYLALGSLTVGDRVTFAARLNGETSFSEELELVALPGQEGWTDGLATPVVEMLSANPARLGVLYRMANKGDVEIAISHNGELVRVAPFLDLVSESAELSLAPVAPHALRTSVTTEAARKPVQRYTCEEICDLEQDDCYEFRCGQFGSASCYNACDDQWIECLEGCGICQPSSSSTTTFTLVSITNTGVQGCYESFFDGKGQHLRYKKKFKKTVTVTSIDFDCSETVTTTITYQYQFCWSFLYPDPYCFSGGMVNLC